MFAPTKVWRRWHRRININQKRYAICSALAASSLPALVMSKGHLIQELPEVPLVVSDQVEKLTKTKDAIELLKQHGAWNDVLKVYKSQRYRAGRGKMRNRRRIQRKGPLVIYSKDMGVSRGFRNIPGVETVNVSNLNLLRLAPGGHVGRFCIWTESAFRKLDKLYGTWRKKADLKKDYNLPVQKMTNTDLSRLLKCEEIKNAVRQRHRRIIRRRVKLNPLNNYKAMLKLNPFDRVEKKINRACNKKMKDLKEERKKAALVPLEREVKKQQAKAALRTKIKENQAAAAAIKVAKEAKRKAALAKWVAKNPAMKKQVVKATWIQQKREKKLKAKRAKAIAAKKDPKAIAARNVARKAANKAFVTALLTKRASLKVKDKKKAEKITAEKLIKKQKAIRQKHLVARAKAVAFRRERAAKNLKAKERKTKEDERKDHKKTVIAYKKLMGTYTKYGPDATPASIKSLKDKKARRRLTIRKNKMRKRRAVSIKVNAHNRLMDRKLKLKARRKRAADKAAGVEKKKKVKKPQDKKPKAKSDEDAKKTVVKRGRKKGITRKGKKTQAPKRPFIKKGGTKPLTLKGGKRIFVKGSDKPVKPKPKKSAKKSAKKAAKPKAKPATQAGKKA